MVLPTWIDDPGATWQPHAPPRPGQRSRLVAPTGTDGPSYIRASLLLPPQLHQIHRHLLRPARNSPSTSAGCPILAAVRLAGASPLSWAWSSTAPRRRSPRRGRLRRPRAPAPPRALRRSYFTSTTRVSRRLPEPSTRPGALLLSPAKRRRREAPPRHEFRRPPAFP